MHPLQLPACILFGIAFAGVAYRVLKIITAPRVVDPSLGRFEEERRDTLRKLSATFRLFEPWVDELKESIERSSKDLEQVHGHLIAAGMPAEWTAGEYLATKRIEAIGAAGLGFVFGQMLGGTTTVVLLAIGSFFVYQMLAKRLLKSNAIRRQIKMKRRFAAVIDLMALMMDVGAAFPDSLKVATRESEGHPLGDELRVVERDMTMGKLDDAMRNLISRTHDDDISEVLLAVIEGQSLGTPLAKTFRTQAEQMRQKRSQWAEKAAAESEVALVFPAMLIMVACLITVAAPFILTAIYNPGG